MQLSTPIGEISGIGPAYIKKLHKMGVKTVSDLIYHFPHRYEDFSHIVPITKVKVNETNCVQGKILGIETARTWKKRMSITEAVVEDEKGAIKVVWFNQPYLAKTLKANDNVCLAGKVLIGKDGIHFSSPIYEKLPAGNYTKQKLTHTGRLVPVYPETEKLSSRWLRYILRPLLTEFKNTIPETLPKKIARQNNFMPLNKAIWQIHFPDSLALANKARERFCFEELFLIELAVLKERMKLNQEIGIAVPLNVDLMKKLVNSLSFKLTDPQKKSAWQILKDMEKPQPMNRLLEGDVGSGKTVVAVMAALNAVKAGYQVAFMAPTEILAKQHFQSIAKLLEKFNLNTGLLTGKEDKFISKKLKNDFIEVSRQKLLEKIKNEEIDILIGTHTLIQDKVKFGNLALVVLDEQHRFGIAQRAKLSKKKSAKVPHLLSMTATPIPRTLALTIYGDLDLSLIDELPKGRKKIITKFIPPSGRQSAYDFIAAQVKEGRQIFVIYPRIEETEEKEDSPWAGVKSVKEEYVKLSKEIFPDFKIAMLHGKMAGKEKERTMRDFKNKKIDILVSTSVVEVGIDIPNASVIMIEGADRFGLAQLHQFRGRVGRSEHQSYCFLFSDSASVKTRQRLKALIDCEDGFRLAEKDLQIRGPGEIYGVRQWGVPDVAMSGLKNLALVEKTREAAKEILNQDPNLKSYPFLKERLQKFHESIHLE
ncbi:MAG: ATP-dependent DNA helicase RecG [bacterium]